MNRNFILITVFLSILIHFYYCSDQSTSPKLKEKPEIGNLSFAIDMTCAPDEVKKISGSLYRYNQDTVFFYFMINENNAVALVEDLITGEWNLQVDAFNENDILIYTGNTDVTILPGQTISVSLHLQPTTGSIEITVDWGNNSDYALEFDGFDDFIIINEHDNFNLELFTIECWIKFNEHKDGGIISKSIPSEGHWLISEGYILRDNIPEYDPQIIIGTGEHQETIRTGEQVPINEWHHVSTTFDGDSLKLFLNGKLMRSKAVNNAIVYTNTTGLFIGQTSNAFFSGYLDEIRIWKIALSEQVINQNMNNKLAGNENGLIAYYTFDKGSGQIALDYAGENNGQLGTTSDEDDSDPIWVISDRQ